MESIAKRYQLYRKSIVGYIGKSLWRSFRGREAPAHTKDGHEGSGYSRGDLAVESKAPRIVLRSSAPNMFSHRLFLELCFC